MAALTAVNTPPIQPIDLLVVEHKLASSIEKAEVKSFGKAGHGTARAFGKCRMACPTGAQVAKALIAAKQPLLSRRTSLGSGSIWRTHACCLIAQQRPKHSTSTLPQSPKSLGSRPSSAIDMRDYYADWHGCDEAPLRYSSAPLREPANLAGHALVTLWLEANQPDARGFRHIAQGWSDACNGPLGYHRR